MRDQKQKSKRFDTRILSRPSFYIPLGVTVISFVILVWGVRMLVGRYGNMWDRISVMRVENEALEKRVSVLRALGGDDFIRDVSAVTSVLPPHDPTLQLTSQLRIKAAEKELVFERLSLGGRGDYESVDGVSMIGMSFSLRGDYKGIISYLSELSRVSPMVKIVDARLKGGLANVTIESYWSDFPETLPSLSGPVVLLSSEDREILAKLSEFSVPDFQEPEDAEYGSSGRTNPFSL